MKLFYYQSSKKINNFGDDLNPWLWDRLLPGVFDQDPKVVFFGIGTLLHSQTPLPTGETRHFIVFSSGVGYGRSFLRQLPKINKSWTIYCLRGPLSAMALKVSAKLAVTDGAVFVNRLFPHDNKKSHRFAFMPHVFSALGHGEIWKAICEDLNFKYIDPQWPIEQILTEISCSEILLSEAFHGAVVADAFRIPWIPICASPNVLSFKWWDWCLAMGLRYQPKYLLPAWTPVHEREGGRLVKYLNWKYKLKCILEHKLIALRTARNKDIKLVSDQLLKIALQSKPILSRRDRFESVYARMEDKLEKFKYDLSNGIFN